MTEGPGHVPDAIFQDLRRHYSEEQIVEIACVVGLFNYFNRFNNALHVEVTLADPDVLVQRAEVEVASGAPVVDLCARVADMLLAGRRYSRVAIYQRDGDLFVLRSPGAAGAAGFSVVPGDGAVGAVVRSGAVSASDDAIVVPVRSGNSVVGVLEAERNRLVPFEAEDRPLLERVADALSSRLA